MIMKKLSTAELLFRSARQLSLNPVWITPLGVFEITVDGELHYIDLAHSPLNGDIGVALAKNKYVSRRIFERHHLQNIPFMLPLSQSDAKEFLKLHHKIIAKPVSGAGAKDIHIITEISQLDVLEIDKYILEKHITGKELRYLLLNGNIVGVHQSEYGDSVAEDRPLRRISFSKETWDPALLKSSVEIAKILNLNFAAIDYLIDNSGKAFILEVNTMPGFKWFHAPSIGPVVNLATLFMQSIIDSVRFEKSLTKHPFVSDLKNVNIGLIG